MNVDRSVLPLVTSEHRGARGVDRHFWVKCPTEALPERDDGPTLCLSGGDLAAVALLECRHEPWGS